MTYPAWYEKAVDASSGHNVIRIKTENASLTLSSAPDALHELSFLVANLDQILTEIGDNDVEQKDDSDPAGQ